MKDLKFTVSVVDYKERNKIMKMYEVCAKCGHVGKNNYVDKVFAVYAESGRSAAAKVRQIPRVKHHHTDAIRYVREIDMLRFNQIIEDNQLDLFFTSHNIQEQRRNCVLEIFREIDTGVFDDDNNNKSEGKPRYYHKKRLRNAKKYINNYALCDDEQRYWEN